MIEGLQYDSTIPQGPLSLVNVRSSEISSEKPTKGFGRFWTSCDGKFYFGHHGPTMTITLSWLAQGWKD